MQQIIMSFPAVAKYITQRLVVSSPQRMMVESAAAEKKIKDAVS
jgi:hypothetical protein